MKIDLSTLKKGYTLIELLIVIAISSVLLATAAASYSSFIKSATKEASLDSINADVSLVFKMIERDVLMAGYGLPAGTRIASHNNCAVSNESFCKNLSDRIFVADGWKILTDVTDNREVDGKVATTYMTNIANKKNDAASGFGYRATLTSAIAVGGTAATLSSLNINNLEEYTASPPPGYDFNDFSLNKALITASTASVEGHRIGNINSNTITLLSNEFFSQAFAPADSSVVPANCWYVRSDPDGKKYSDGSTIYWLYRNGDAAMPYVDNFKIRYGYDKLSNGIQWDSIVPPSFIPDAPTNTAFDFTQLKVIEITMNIKFVNNGVAQNTSYMTVIGLRN